MPTHQIGTSARTHLPATRSVNSCHQPAVVCAPRGGRGCGSSVNRTVQLQPHNRLSTSCVSSAPRYSVTPWYSFSWNPWYRPSPVYVGVSAIDGDIRPTSVWSVLAAVAVVLLVTAAVIGVIALVCLL